MVTLVPVSRKSSERETRSTSWLQGTPRDSAGNERFEVYGTHRSVQLSLVSGAVVSVASDAPDSLAQALERARTFTSPRLRVPAASRPAVEPNGEDEIPRDSEQTAATRERRE